LTTAGGTALSTVADGRNPMAVSIRIPPSPVEAPADPRARTVGIVAIASAPPRTSRTGIKVRGLTRSAARPPTHAPMAIPASTVPMMPV
jgi:hypothetical protein